MTASNNNIPLPVLINSKKLFLTCEADAEHVGYY